MKGIIKTMKTQLSNDRCVEIVKSVCDKISDIQICNKAFFSIEVLSYNTDSHGFYNASDIRIMYSGDADKDLYISELIKYYRMCIKDNKIAYYTRLKQMMLMYYLKHGCKLSIGFMPNTSNSDVEKIKELLYAEDR